MGKQTDTLLLAIVVAFGVCLVAGLVVLPAIHEANAKKTHELSASSFTDGYAQGIKDAGRDLKGLNGHGYDSSCPEGHTDVFCNGYKQGYDHEWEAP